MIVDVGIGGVGDVAIGVDDVDIGGGVAVSVGAVCCIGSVECGDGDVGISYAGSVVCDIVCIGADGVGIGGIIADGCVFSCVGGGDVHGCDILTTTPHHTTTTPATHTMTTSVTPLLPAISHTTAMTAAYSTQSIQSSTPAYGIHQHHQHAYIHTQ